jgi:hypothetical protein
LVRAASVEGCGTAVAVGEKIGVTMVAKATNAMPAHRKEENSSELAGDVEEAFMAAPSFTKLNMAALLNLSATTIRL